MSYLFFFLAGLFGANFVPHFVKGITGEKHQSPLGKPSSAVVNVVWGAINAFGAAWLFRLGVDRPHRFGCALLAGAAGVLLMGVGLAHYWSNDDAARGR